ncbi:hypothetical protein BESB_019860 [Besnoitia besnoiti]|uniref:Uncharacterized protein n=1 Tax=Besnoitia besnoiti TaxID=94643 RepID=A0A2A9M231_BESBE|nr:hypothetical protein BESB_019860 [Besnoitia besnoiti]PFH32045.1 hypothetical protein BESB_019860 [Besnoitia besnoiti]
METPAPLPSGSPRARRDETLLFLNEAGAHVSVLLETVEQQLKDMSTDLLPPTRESPREPRSSATAAPAPPAAAPAEALHGDQAPAMDAEAREAQMHASSEARFFAKNVEYVQRYHATCCSLNRLLHAEVERMDPLREAVCGDSLYNAALQVENLELLNAEKKKLAKLKQEILSTGTTC